MKIIVISDLHVGDGAVSNEFSVGTSTNAVKNRFLIELKELATRENISADYLVVAGDITNRATKEEFQLASKRVQEISTIVGVPSSNIFFVPGNHDGDWTEEEESMMSNEDVNITIERKYRNLRINDFFNERLSCATEGFVS